MAALTDTETSSLEGTFGSHLVQPSAQARPLGSIYPELCPDGGRITFLHLLAILLSHVAQDKVSLFATRAHCWLMINLVSTRMPKSCSAKPLSIWIAPSMYWH